MLFQFHEGRFYFVPFDNDLIQQNDFYPNQHRKNVPALVVIPLKGADTLLRILLVARAFDFLIDKWA